MFVSAIIDPKGVTKISRLWVLFIIVIQFIFVPGKPLIRIRIRRYLWNQHDDGESEDNTSEKKSFLDFRIDQCDFVQFKDDGDSSEKYSNLN